MSLPGLQGRGSSSVSVSSVCSFSIRSLERFEWNFGLVCRCGFGLETVVLEEVGLTVVGREEPDLSLSFNCLCWKRVSFDSSIIVLRSSCVPLL